MLIWAGLGMVLSLLPAFHLINSAAAAEPMAEGHDDLSIYSSAKVPSGATNGLGSWIWAGKTFDRQTCRLWKKFEIPARTKVNSARMCMTVDNGYQFFLDGRELGQGADWRGLTEYDLTQLLPPGEHVLAVNAFNDYFQAGMIMGLHVELDNGQIMDIKSDQSWRVVPESEQDWQDLKQARADWPPVQTITGTNRAPQWIDYRWPFDFISVPRFYTLVIPFWQTGWFHLMLAAICGLIMLVCIALLVQLAWQSSEQRLLHLERARIARDIHDDVGTRLTKLVLQGEVAQSTLPPNSQGLQQFNTICDGLRDVLGAMDEVLWAVNPRHDTLENFIAYICDYAQTFLQNTKIQCLLEVESDMPPLNFDLPLRRSLLLVVKEALNNAAKHSGASRLLLKIFRSGPKLVVAVEDDGSGFDLNQAKQRGNGLANLFHRMSEADGSCRIVTRPGAGCQVEFSISLTRHPTRSWFFNRIQSFGRKDNFVGGTAFAEDSKTPPGSIS